MDLKTTINLFRSRGREGGYWDFKRQWHEDKADLLLDIICMANNIENRDAYIIIGIQDHTMQIIGVENDTNRLSLSNLSQFVSGKHFVMYSPEIDLQTITLEGHEIDIIIVRNTNHTPYYLEKNFKGVKKELKHGQLYIRINDRNAGYDCAAPYWCIEYLWKKRLGINLSIMERLMILLDDTDKWIHDWGNKKYAYHKEAPEFHLEQVSEMKQGWVPAAAFYAHTTMYWADLNIMYHNTIIYETGLWCFDEFRKYLPPATNSSVQGIQDFWYSYYQLDSIEGKLFKIFNHNSLDLSSRECDYHQILIFKSQSEREKYDEYLKDHFNDYTDEQIEEEYKFQIMNDTKSNNGGQLFSAFQVAKAAKIYTQWKKTECGIH